MSNLVFKVEGNSITATKFSGKARQFNLVIDEPEGLGGEDAAANPVEFILAGFAGCINVVGHLVAKDLGITLRGINIEVSGDINPNKFLGLSDEDRAGFKSITLNVVPDTDAPLETLQQWIKIVEQRCPVKDNLANSTPVELALVKEYNV